FRIKHIQALYNEFNYTVMKTKRTTKANNRKTNQPFLLTPGFLIFLGAFKIH
ncbi:26890_t:CDS:2, partial [Racocetra persica]